MEFTSINIQGNIISSEILQKIRNEDIRYQTAAEFGLDKKTSVRDEIGISWAAVKAHWTAFTLRAQRLKEGDSGTSETRNSWMIPFLRELGYDVQNATTFIHPDTQKTYAISHKAANLNGFPIHIMGINDDLDKRRESSGPRLSPHALVQEYLNNTDHAYALVSNGRYLRLLRDATRLVRLSYLEVDLEKMMEEDLYADFAVIFRLLHATRMPKEAELTEESYIEYYHQESLASGQRIRERLSKAVEESIKTLANGFLSHPHNTLLREQVSKGVMQSEEYYQLQLRLIYRFLFLIVTEERQLIYPDTKEDALQRKRKIYYDYYSIERLRKLAAKAHFVDGRKQDLWEGLKTTFLLFENGNIGEKLGIKPLGSGIFSPSALGILSDLSLDNHSLLRVIRCLTLFENENKQLVRVNYSDLDVEEFGSVYEGLLEYAAVINQVNGMPSFSFVEGTDRSSSGSHYTPEELVKPLIKHSLEYIIEDKLKEKDKEQALLSIKVCDVACGSGHILLSAARRIALELARARTNEDQPTPTAIRKATRDVIKECIYGVDKNPLAVELCKVALWLEAHNPGEPLNFLDHHIKCGDAIVGLGHKEELYNGVPDEAFKSLTGDDKEIIKKFRKFNKEERETREQLGMVYEEDVNKPLEDVLERFHQFASMPERTPEEIQAKDTAYHKLLKSDALNKLKVLSDLLLTQFFLSKDEKNESYLVTDGEFLKYLRGQKKVSIALQAKAVELASQHKFLHWFLEFPDVFMNGGFDCILGNPPFLGGQKLSGNFGLRYLEYLKYQYAPVGAVDLVTYFFRRTFDIIRSKGFISLISTNTIAQGSAREGGLDVIVSRQGSINHAVRSMKWPGVAAVEVALVTVHKGKWDKRFVLGNKDVNTVTAYLDDAEEIGGPYPLKQNEGKSFQGSIVLGKGFVLEPEEAEALIQKDPKNKEVLFPYLNGDDLNNNPDQRPSRWVINFFDWPLDRFSQSEWAKLADTHKEGINQRLEEGKVIEIGPPWYGGSVASDYPVCLCIIEKLVKPERLAYDENKNSWNRSVKQYWWQFGAWRKGLEEAILNLGRTLVISEVTKYATFSFIPKGMVYMHTLKIPTFENFSFLSLINCSFHESWAWKYSSRMGDTTLRYSLSDAFQTYPFLKAEIISANESLELVGESYSNHRSNFMLKLQLGITRTYNLFHNNILREITSEEEAMEDKAFEKRFGKEPAALRKHLAKTSGTISFNEAVKGIIKLRELHVEMDQAVLEAYSWGDVQLKHDFYEVDYLPENDRIRYTIHPEARKEILKRLLELNHKIHEEEVTAGLWDKKKSSKGEKKGKKKEVKDSGQGSLF